MGTSSFRKRAPLGRGEHREKGKEGGRGLLAVAPTTPRPRGKGLMRGKGSPCNPRGPTLPTWAHHGPNRSI